MPLSATAIAAICVVVTTTALIVISSVRIAGGQRERTLARLRAEWGTGPPRNSHRNKSVSSRFEFSTPKPGVAYAIDDSTWNDLDLDAVFEHLDHTQSPMGAQALYRAVREPSLVRGPLERRQFAVDVLGGQQELRETIQIQLSRLRNVDLHLPELLWQPIPEGLFPLWLTRALPVILVASLVGGAMLQSLALWATAGALVIGNAVIHTRTSAQIVGSLSAVASLAALVAVADRIAKMADFQRCLPELSQDLGARLHRAVGLKRRAAFVDMHDPTGAGEYLRVVFLSDVNQFFGSAQFISRHIDDLRDIFDTVGWIDATISIASYRQGNAVTSPRLLPDSSRLIVHDLRHPLVANAVGNDLSIGPRGLLVTGSNMAGKTTLLKSLAVNSVLGQALGLVCAGAFESPFVRVVSAMNARDDLMAGKSYYRAELDMVHRLVRAVRSAGCHLLVLDEIFRGTNPLERSAAVAAVLNYLADGQFVIAATHDLQVCDRCAANFDEGYLCEAKVEHGFEFDYKLRTGRIRRPNAIAMLARTGYPQAIVSAAQA